MNDEEKICAYCEQVIDPMDMSYVRKWFPDRKAFATVHNEHLKMDQKAKEWTNMESSGKDKPDVAQ